MGVYVENGYRLVLWGKRKIKVGEEVREKIIGNGVNLGDEQQTE